MQRRTALPSRLIQLLALLLLGATLAAMFPPKTAWAVWWSEQAAWAAFFLTLLGLIFFILGRIQTAFVCLGYAAAISYWLCETGRGEQLLNF